MEKTAVHLVGAIVVVSALYLLTRTSTQQNLTTVHTSFQNIDIHEIRKRAIDPKAASTGNNSLSINTTHPPQTNNASGNASTHGKHKHGNKNHVSIHVASWRYSYVRLPLWVCLCLIIAAFLKIGFHHAKFLSSLIPESCCLIVFGLVVGGVIHASGNSQNVSLQPKMFMLFLLPPIVLDSAYSLHDRVFFNNIGTILLYAVVGTLMNCFMIGPALFGLSRSGAMGIHLSLVQCLVFSSLIVAVDPVAVLAIFSEIGVNNVLYFLVFGESLLNDAVTVVLYNMMKTFNEMEEIPISEIGLGIASFFSVSLGGLAIGVIFGVTTAVATKHTSHVRVVEPLMLLLLAYLAYLTAELVHFSGIISMIGCGLVQAEYSFHNIARKSYTTVKYFIKMASGICDCIIFVFLGLELVRSSHQWHTGFVMWTLLCCLFFRLVSVGTLTFLANRVDRVHPIDFQEQFIMWYGGLRGAVCFALVATLDHDLKDMFLTATLTVIIFTVFIQGITIKPLVRLLKIRRQERKSKSVYEAITCHVTDHMMSGIETVIDQVGNNRLWTTCFTLNDRFLKRWLQKDPMSHDERILHVYQKVAMKDHYRQIGRSGSAGGPAEGAINNGFEEDVCAVEIQSEPDLYDEAAECQELQQEAARRASMPKEKEVRTTSLFQVASMKTKLNRWRKASAKTKEPNVDDVNKFFTKHAIGAKMLHQKYDPDLANEEDSLLSQLHEKHMRIQRQRRSQDASAQFDPDRRTSHPAMSKTSPPKAELYKKRRSTCADIADAVEKARKQGILNLWGNKQMAQNDKEDKSLTGASVESQTSLGSVPEVATSPDAARRPSNLHQVDSNDINNARQNGHLSYMPQTNEAFEGDEYTRL